MSIIFKLDEKHEKYLQSVADCVNEYHGGNLTVEKVLSNLILHFENSNGDLSSAASLKDILDKLNHETVHEKRCLEDTNDPIILYEEK